LDHQRQAERLLVALASFWDLFVRAKDLFVAAKDGKSPSH
jgi:hypothetical protein